ncbi:hypothetical protein TNCV_3901781 [Trichonephila clavipes]|nr:hypothetical protein TNCV_3901781 [Trichonephila clavipes]
MVYHHAGTTRSGTQWLVLLATNLGELGYFHKFKFLQPYHAVSNLCIRLATPLGQVNCPPNVSTDDVDSWLFIESSSSEQVVAICPDKATEWAGLVSSQVKPEEVCS